MKGVLSLTRESSLLILITDEGLNVVLGVDLPSNRSSFSRAKDKNV
jgi:hypothetical protein